MLNKTKIALTASFIMITSSTSASNIKAGYQSFATLKSTDFAYLTITKKPKYIKNKTRHRSKKALTKNIKNFNRIFEHINCIDYSVTALPTQKMRLQKCFTP